MINEIERDKLPATANAECIVISLSLSSRTPVYVYTVEPICEGSKRSGRTNGQHPRRIMYCKIETIGERSAGAVPVGPRMSDRCHWNWISVHGPLLMKPRRKAFGNLRRIMRRI